MDITIIGLQNAGKTTLARVLAGGEFTTDAMPTVGFNLKRIQAGHVTLNAWDIGGQPQYRTMWERYCLNSACIVFVVDAADKEAVPIAREELQALLKNETLNGIPLLVLGNKSDIPGTMDVDDLIDTLGLREIRTREMSCYGISAKKEVNLDAVVKWLVGRAGKQ